MLLGVIADDFTGASDVANALARGHGGGGGLATTQFLGLPSRPAPETCEAGVVALKSRSVPAADAVALSLEAFEWLRAQGCRQYLFKYCSTFDSTPEGNIGPVGEALARALDVRGVVACPAFPGAGRTLYQGHLFVGDRPLDESGLENHPLNPMTDADLRRWLARQSRDPVGLVPWATVRAGAGAIRTALDAAAGRGERLAIVDAVADEDLVAIGQACVDAPLLTGGSGIALGLPENFRRSGLTAGGGDTFAGVEGRGAILAGSCSRATLAQVERHARDHPALAVTPEDAMSGAVTPETLTAFVEAHAEGDPLVYSSSESKAVRRAQERHGREALSARLDALFAETARRLVHDGLARLVVAGGETSGAVVLALGLDALSIGPEIAPGVPALRPADGRAPALALKSGNFGGPDFFARALATLRDGRVPDDPRESA